MECPRCTHDEMIRMELIDGTEYWCSMCNSYTLKEYGRYGEIISESWFDGRSNRGSKEDSPRKQ